MYIEDMIRNAVEEEEEGIRIEGRISCIRFADDIIILGERAWTLKTITR